MWIFLGIVLFLLLLIIIILLLPFSLIIKTDQNGEFIFNFKLLLKTFHKKPDENSDKPLVKALKDMLGLGRLDAQNIKENSKKGNLLTVLRENLSLITNLLSEILKVLKSCTVKVLKIDIICGSDNAADTAISYGVCYAVVSPLLNFIHNKMRVKEQGEKINISADFNGKNTSYSFEIVLVTRVYMLVLAFINLVKDEVKRILSNRTKHQKSRKN